MGDQARQEDFEKVMLPHLDAAYNLARWLVRDPSIAEDVVQDAYERACKYFAAFRGGPGRPWLLQIVRNAAYSALTAERQHMAVSLSGATRADDEDGVDMDIADSRPGPEATLAQRQDLGALDNALSELPLAWRECLILREVEGLSYKEIARVVGIPIGTVMSRLSRARQALHAGQSPQPHLSNAGPPVAVTIHEPSASTLVDSDSSRQPPAPTGGAPTYTQPPMLKTSGISHSPSGRPRTGL